MDAEDLVNALARCVEILRGNGFGEWDAVIDAVDVLERAQKQ